MNDIVSYAECFEYGKKKLSDAGILDAALDARLLLESVCGTNYSTLLAHGDRQVTDNEKRAYFEQITQREKRIPLAYILGTQEFMGLDFDVSSDVLIPNQDTETLVEEALGHLFEGMNFLDLCTGSGCIALSLLKYSNGTRAVATDISEKALLIASANAKKLELSDRISFFQNDVLDESAEMSFKGFDLIVSNPPYIRTSVIPSLEPEVSRSEPYIALDGDEDGLKFYHRICALAPKLLNRSGYLLMEIGFDQAEDVAKIMSDNNFKDIEVVKDFGGNERVLKGWIG